MKILILPIILLTLLTFSCNKKEVKSKDDTTTASKETVKSNWEDEIREEQKLKTIKKTFGDAVTYEGIYKNVENETIKVLFINEGERNFAYLFDEENELEDIYLQKEAWAKGAIYVDEENNELIVKGKSITLKEEGKETTFNEVK